jgi:perosamine synthetase
MPISRGSIRHSLSKDAINLISSFLRPNRFFSSASPELRAEVTSAVALRLSVTHATLFPFARTGLYATLKALDLPPGSQILMTPFTIGPMLEVINALGYRPIFVDIELDTFGPDLEQLALKLDGKPACLLLTYLFGYVPDVERIERMCRNSQTVLIEDFSHNIGATCNGRALGTFGSVGIYSASLTKFVDGYNGSFVVTNDSLIASRLNKTAGELLPPNRQRLAAIIRRTFIWNFALSRHSFNLFTFPSLWLLKVLNPALFDRVLGPSIALRLDSPLPRYYFEDIARFQCEAILLNLSKLDTTLESRRASARQALGAYHRALSKRKPSRPDRVSLYRWGEPTFWQFVVPVIDMTVSRDQLFRAGIETGGTNLRNLAATTGVDLPNARKLSKHYLFIPLHRHLQDPDYFKVFDILDEVNQIE